MDEIFHDPEVSGWKGAFTVVKVAKNKPHRYGKKGELLINYDDTEEARRASVRRASSVAGSTGEKFGGNGDATRDRVEHIDEK